MKNRVLFLLPYPLRSAPSQRFRIEAYFDLMRNNKVAFDTDSFLDEAAWKVLYQKGSTLKKVLSVIKGFIRRALFILLKAHKYQYIFIHREAAPIGPPVFEWLLARIFHKKIIYDFDDAIWIPNTTDSNRFASFVKCFWKVRLITQWSYKISAGNNYLADWAGQFNSSVFVNPTCVDMQIKYNKVKNHETSIPVIGWTGSHSTLKYLDEIVPALRELEQKHSFRFMVICDKQPTFYLKSLCFRAWNEVTEIEDLLHINIGIMPLIKDSWSEGKCGFKLIQYLSLGIPAVAEPIGVNKQIIVDGINGYLCSTKEEWQAALEELLFNPQLRMDMGKQGVKKMLDEFSIESNSLNFLSFFLN